MSNQPISPTGPDDWDKLIDNPFNIGPFSRTTRAGDWWVITGMHVRLPEALAGRPAGTSKLLVFADTISVVGVSKFDGLSDVLLIAHQHRVAPSSQLSRSKLNGKETFRIAVFGRTLSSPASYKFLDFVMQGDRDVVPAEFRWRDTVEESGRFYGTIRELVQIEFNLATQYKGYEHRRLPLPDSGPGFDACREFLARRLLTAQSLIDAGRPDDANHLLDRIEELVPLNPDPDVDSLQVASWQEILAECAATREMLKPQLPGSDLVPDLSAKVYGGVAKSYGEALKTFADTFNRFVDRGTAIKHRKDAAALMLGKEDNAITFQGLVTKQLEENLDVAEKNLARAQASMESQSKRVEEAEKAFQRGLNKWREDQQRKAALAITMAVFSAVTSFASIAFGKPPDLAGLAKKAEEVGTIADLARFAMRFSDLLKKLDKIMKVVAELVKTTFKILPDASKLMNARQLAAGMAEVRREADASDLGGAPSESAYWDEFWVEIETALAPAVGERVPGATQYLQQLKVLIIYGRALTTAQAALPPIAQELAQSALLTKLAEEQSKAIDEHMQTLQSGTASSVLAVTLWLRHRSVRRAMFAALQDYDAAHRYWALKVERPTRRDPNESMEGLAKDLMYVAELEARAADALKNFSPGPQDFKGLSFKVPAENVADFVRRGSFTLLFTRNSSPVTKWGNVGRVRVKEVAAWVIWNKGKRPKRIEFTIGTDGNYYDQRVEKGKKGKPGEMREFRFIGPQVDRKFLYKPAQKAGDRQASVIVHAKVAEDFRAQYSEPTLFTEWQFSLVGGKKALKALKGAVKGIKLQFWGTFLKAKGRF